MQSGLSGGPSLHPAQSMQKFHGPSHAGAGRSGKPGGKQGPGEAWGMKGKATDFFRFAN